MLRTIIIAIGAAAGFGYGYQTRPSLLGVKVPLDIIASNHAMDAPFRSDLISHLTVSTLMGAGIAVAVVVVISLINNQKGAGENN